MKDSRVGEALWSEWFGNGYQKSDPNSVVFYTEGHIDIHNEIVRRALASAIQRDGISDSLGEAFRLLDGTVTVVIGNAGFVDGEYELTQCEEDGMTPHEDIAESVIPITWVEVYDNR
jgi:hypothetical protein